MNDNGSGAHKDSGKKKKSRSWADLRPRLISAFFLIAITIFTVWAGGIWFAIFVALGFAGVMMEWEKMIARKPIEMSGIILTVVLALVALVTSIYGFVGTLVPVGVGILIVIFSSNPHKTWRAGGFLFFSLVIFALITVRGETYLGFAAIFFLGTTVWMTDTGAFFAGRHFGGAKLNPEISPAKTWSGAIGGLIAGSLGGLFIWMLSTPSPWWIGLFIASAVSVSGQLGDLSESAVKRFFQVKDTGDAIPGHGGLLDRLDSLTFGVLLIFIVGAWHAAPDMAAAGLLVW